MAASEGQIRETLTALEQSLRAGLPLSRTEWTLGLPPALAGPLRAAIGAGRPLAETLGKTLGLLPHEQLLLGAGERAGHLPEALQGVLEGRAQRIKLRRKMMVALAYPVLVLCAAIVFLPLPLIFVESARVYFTVVGSGLVVVGTPLLFVFVLWPRLPPSRLKALPWLIARATPVLGRRLAWGPTALFCDVLGRSVSAGLPIRSALGPALDATGDPIFADAAVDVERTIDRGGSLAEALEQVDDLPGEVKRQVAVAETTGSLDKVLAALSVDATDRHRRTLWALVVAIGAMVFAIAALVAVVGIVGAAQTFYFDKMDAQINEAEQ